MSSHPTAWQNADVASKFVEGRRAFVPYGSDQLRIMLQVVEHFRPAPRRLLDLGCGDGIVARSLLSIHPGSAALLLDHSEPMLERARAAMAGFAERCDIRLADLADSLARHVADKSVELVVSGYAIHHLPNERKRQLYGEIFACLAPGGLFVNLEHVASASPRVEALFDRLYIDHLSEGQGRPRQEVAAEYHGRPDKGDNILESVEVQVGWLRELGFEDVDCYFRWLELAVFGGVKPAANGTMSSGD